MTNALRDLARGVQSFVEDWPRAGAEESARAITKRVQRDTGGDGGLSGARELGRATVEVDASSGEATISAGGSMSIWAMIESGTSSHEIRARGSGRRAVLRTPYGPRRTVRVSGTRGRRTWTEGSEDGLDAAAKVADRMLGGL